MPIAKIHRTSATAPDDVAGIEAAIHAGRLDPKGVMAVLGKTEGNGCVNDFSRGYASLALGNFLRKYLADEKVAQICLVMSGGTEGGRAPHWTIFERADGTEGQAPALAVGRAHTAELPLVDLGRLGQVYMVAREIAAAMRDAGIDSAKDVHFVQIKCPLLTAQRIGEARSRGTNVATTDTLKSMGLSRAASALGVAEALGEIERKAITDAAIGQRWDLWSGRASCSAGIELLGHEIVALGMSAAWSGPLIIDHAVMADGIDVEPVRSALARVGLGSSGQLPAAQRSRLVAMLAKAEPGFDGKLREFRHTMLDDSDISPTRHARGFVCGVLAGLVGHAEIYVSGGAEHQGPTGGGPVAVIAQRA